MIKIKHNISLQEDERTLSGHILETIFLDGAERGECIEYYSNDWEFYIGSSAYPYLNGLEYLTVWWELEEYDNQKVSRTYDSKEEALKILAYINEFSIEEEVIWIDKFKETIYRLPEQEQKIYENMYICLREELLSQTN